LADVELAALKQLTGMVVRQAEVMTMNTLFHTLAMIFLCSLLLMPWVSKVSADAGDAARGH
jgi:DHA2 family multidrug resistance protein